MKSILFTKPKPVTLECLRYLVEQGEELLGVIVYDKPAYAGSVFTQYCEKAGVPLFDASETDFCFEKNRDQIDMIYCNTFPKRLKREWLEAAKIAAINFHCAPLPEYQGAFCYNFAFLNQEKEYGITCHFLTEQIDKGAIIEVVRFPYDFEKGSLEDLVDLSNQHLYRLFCKTYQRFKSGEKITGQPQSGGIYYSRKDFEREKEIRPGESAELSLRRIQAFWYPPYEGAYIRLGGKKVFLLTEQQYKALVDALPARGQMSPDVSRMPDSAHHAV